MASANSVLGSISRLPPLFSLAKFADGCELRGERRELGFDSGDFLLVLGMAPRLFGSLKGFGRLGLVQIVAADRSVGEHGHHFGLHFEDAARDEDELLFAAADGLEP